MQLKKLLKVGVISAVTTTALLGSCFSNETHAALADQPSSDTQVKYFNASFYDVNPEGYNSYHRKNTPRKALRTRYLSFAQFWSSRSIACWFV